MRPAPLIAIVILAAVAAFGTARLLRSSAPAAGATLHTVSRGPLAVDVTYDGTVESRQTTAVASPLSQPAVVIELAPEGMVVPAGAVLARFDPAALARDVIRAEKEARLARARRNQLEAATHPLQLADLATRLDEARGQAQQAHALLADTRALAADALVAAQDVAQQERDAARLDRLVAAFEQQLATTRDIQQPAEREQAAAEEAAAERELDYLRTQLDGCTVTAATPGLVIHVPLAFSGDYRPVRVGDTVYRNQQFLTVADMSNLVVRCHAPEAELGLVSAGQGADVMPLAFPELRLPATVAAIGAMAQSVAGRPGWQKYFRLTLALDQPHPLLRPGMTARVRVRVYARASAVLLPRRAITWQGDTATCRVDAPAGPRDCAVTLGLGDETTVEVLAGIEPGSRVWVP